MKRKKVPTLKELQEAYRLNCLYRYYGLLFAYLCDFIVKIYLLYKVLGIKIAYLGAVIDFVAKCIHLKETKFRKRGFYKTRRKKCSKNGGRK